MDEQTDPHRCTQILSFTWKLFTCLFTHVMLVTMVVAYCLLGAVTFENLEKENEIFVKMNISFMRSNVTEDLWKFTQEAVVLRQDNWTANALARLKTFENDLVLAMRKAGWDGSEELESLQWTFTGALFYSIIVITTIGYGHIAPKTHLGKVTTIFYAIVGIPLMLLCLSNIGDIMAHSFRFLYWKVCCYSCTKEEQARNSYRQRRHRRCEVDGMKEVGPAHHGIGSSVRHKNHPQPYTPAPPQGNPEVIITQNILCNKYAFEEEDYGENANHGGKKDEMDRENTNPMAKMKSSGNLGRRSQEHLNTSPRIMSPMGFIVPRQNQAKGRDRDYYLEEYNEDISGSRGIKPVPIWLCVFLVVSYIMGGAFLFSDWEDWGFADSAYFCFITLTTIGFGDFVPAQRVNNKNGEMSIALCSLYLLFGIALLAMSFNLVQEEVITNVKAVAKHLGIIKEDGEPLD